ncbi:MAG: flagellar hook-basal body protein [Bdellovibrionales bacterium]|nr:flagellar hook-basal body protein [Bdellovibrionales bacterium]
MSKGLWPAVSGSIAQGERLDVIANNLANVDTAGFKKDRVAFQQVLSSAATAAQKEEIPRKLYTEKDMHKLDGRDAAYVVLSGTHTDHAQGRVKVTNSPLDVALEGNGMLEVLGPGGARYTRQGSLKLLQDGTLVTMEGYPVLSRGGNDAAATGPVPREELAARAIRLDPNRTAPVVITTNGRIFQGREQVAELSVVEFADARLLEKEGTSLFRNILGANIVQDAPKTVVRQGMLETSNVNAVAEMTELLKATRIFENNQKIVKTYGELEGRAVNDIGKL